MITGFSEYKDAVRQVKIGKHLPDATYLHKSALDSLPDDLAAFIKEIAKSQKLTRKWNVVKLSRKDFKLSLLSYPDFDTESYPALKASYTIDLEKITLRKSDYSKSENPPILHRKETFVTEDYPKYKLFQELTAEGEEAGLYENTRKIGFKQSWESLIRSKGYELIAGTYQKA
ncbi:hypothetical protein H8E50_08435 [bacterium]|nr:hypothetical protein [bacterium]